jgi:predicted type IV restriction endonuclease
MNSWGSLSGQRYPARNARDVLVSVFETLSQRDGTFLERFAALPKHGRTRRYLARSPEELYPGRPDLSHEHSAQLSSGWWLGTNVSRAQIERIIEMACEVARVKYGRELSVNLGE